jgi:hypothetical protein
MDMEKKIKLSEVIKMVKREPISKTIKVVEYFLTDTVINKKKRELSAGYFKQKLLTKLKAMDGE